MSTSTLQSRVRRRVVVVVVLGLVFALLPSLAGVRVTATPRTQVDTIEGFSSAPGARAAGVEGRQSRPTPAPMAFSMVGFSIPGGVEHVRLRTSPDGERWSEWMTAERRTPDEGPDRDSREFDQNGQQVTHPVWVDEARHLQIAVSGARPEQVGATLIDSSGLDGGPVNASVVQSSGAEAASLDVVSRSEWGAAAYKGDPYYADDVDMMIVHHTVTGNDYSEADAPDVVRAIQSYHQDTLDWDDIGYNMLVDRYGNIYEGRAGGLKKAVVGAHARGWNTGSSGIASLGTHSKANPTSAALSALIDAMAWKALIHDIDPEGTTTEVGDGSRKPTVAGHRNVGSTACPGDELYNELSWMRGAVADDMQVTCAEDSSAVHPFIDVGSTHPFCVEIAWMAGQGISEGYPDGTYRPATAMTRQAAAAFLARLANADLSTCTTRPFSDVPTDFTFCPEIAWMKDAGITNGYDDGTYRPGADVTRRAAAAFLARLAGADLSACTSKPFDDVSPGDPFCPEIAWMKDAGITDGYDDNTFRPAAEVTRQAIAAFLHRFA